jgi:GxxExxY protein
LRIRRPEDPLTEAVIGAAMEVHSALGPGFFEGQYEEAFAKELQIRNIPFERQKEIPLTYKEVPIGQYRLDFLVDKQLVVELKAVDSFSSAHTSQVIAYLAATKLKVGLLINFNVASLRTGIKRVLFDK